MNTTERHERNTAIAAARKAGERTGSIARRFGVTDRQARRILAEQRSDPAREAIENPEEVLEATLAAYEEEASKLSEIAAHAPSDAVRLSAIKTRVRVLERKSKLIASVGLMPPPETIRFDREARELAQAIFDVFDEYDIPNEVEDKIAETISRRSC